MSQPSFEQNQLHINMVKVIINIIIPITNKVNHVYLDDNRKICFNYIRTYVLCKYLFLIYYVNFNIQKMCYTFSMSSIIGKLFFKW